MVSPGSAQPGQLMGARPARPSPATLLMLYDAIAVLDSELYPEPDPSIEGGRGSHWATTTKVWMGSFSAWLSSCSRSRFLRG